jgi:hypothetical protein
MDACYRALQTLGTVDQKSHTEILFGIGGEHHRIYKPQSKDITVDELLEFRRMLTRAGWSPDSSAEADTGENASHLGPAVTPTPPDLLVVADDHEAKIYHLDWPKCAVFTSTAVFTFPPFVLPRRDARFAQPSLPTGQIRRVGAA